MERVLSNKLLDLKGTCRMHDDAGRSEHCICKLTDLREPGSGE